MPELLITSSLDPIEEGEVFSIENKFRRHVTVWQYFDLPDVHLNEFIANVGNAIEGFSPLEIVGDENDEFGPDNDVPVRRVKALGEKATLITLHTVLGEVIERHEGVIRNQEWAYQGYNPHVTYMDGRALEKGERATLSSVELIESSIPSKNKIVRKIWGLEEA